MSPFYSGKIFYSDCYGGAYIDENNNFIDLILYFVSILSDVSILHTSLKMLK